MYMYTIVNGENKYNNQFQALLDVQRNDIS